MNDTTAENGALLWGMGWGGIALSVFAVLVILALVKALYFADKNDKK